nr:questin oxidase family protein [Aliikangiella sp. G2MR2-5]
MPMALTALCQLGADSSRLETFYQYYAKKLITFERQDLASDFNFDNDLGDTSYFPQYLAYFEFQIAKYGIEKTVAKHIDRLIPGVAASAFHALIRLAYALEVKQPDEVAMALAFWSADYQFLGTCEFFGSAKSYSNQSPLEILNSQQHFFEQLHFEKGIIVDRMNQVSAATNWETTPLVPQSLNLETIAAIAIRLYLRDKDFTLLHGVTGTHALRVLMPYIQKQDLALKYFWIAYWAAYQTTKTWEVSSENKITKMDENEISLIKKQAVKSDNDHTIKLVYSCFQEYKHYNNTDFLLAAKDKI